MASDDDVPRLRARAKQARQMADHMQTASTRELLLRIAQDCDEAADRIEKRQS